MKKGRTITDSELTDDEESDSPEIRERRKGNKAKLLMLVDKELKKAEEETDSIYTPDQRSRDWAKKYFIHPILQSKSPKYRKNQRNRKKD